MPDRNLGRDTRGGREWIIGNGVLSQTFHLECLSGGNLCTLPESDRGNADFLCSASEDSFERVLICKKAKGI